MQFRYRLLACALSIAGMTSALTGLASTAAAQSVDPLDANRRRTEDPLSNQAGPASDPFFDIMHRAQLGNIRSISEYSQDQQDNIGSQASDFRTRQRALIQQNQQGTPVPTEIAPVQPAVQPVAQPVSP